MSNSRQAILSGKNLWGSACFSLCREPLITLSIHHLRFLRNDDDRLVAPSLAAREHLLLRKRGARLLGQDNLAELAALSTLLATTDGDIPAIASAVKLLGKKPNTDIALVGYDAESPGRLERIKLFYSRDGNAG